MGIAWSVGDTPPATIRPVVATNYREGIVQNRRVASARRERWFIEDGFLVLGRYDALDAENQSLPRG